MEADHGLSPLAGLAPAVNPNSAAAVGVRLSVPRALSLATTSFSNMVSKETSLPGQPDQLSLSHSSFDLAPSRFTGTPVRV